MKLAKTRIARSIVALMLVLFTTFSLSSCFFDVGIYRDIWEDMEAEESKNKEENKTPSPDESPDVNDGEDEEENPDNDDPIIKDDEEEEEIEIGEMYPGSGESSLENVSALSKTLLSTVIVYANSSSPSTASGVFYQIDKENGDAYIITNYHVVYDKFTGLCEDITVYLYGMLLESYAIPATFIGGSSTYDVAVLRVEDSEILKQSYATTVSFASSDDVRVFDTVYTVGNPEGHGFAVTKGIVSVESEQIVIEGAEGVAIQLRVIRVDAAVNSGNSGGGLFNENGELIGIVSAKRVGSDVDNMGYAIPSNLVYYLVNNILDNCDGVTNTQIKKALMGITISSSTIGVVVDPETGDVKQAELVEVIDVSLGSLAFGKIQIGDIINSITLDGVTVEVTRMHHVTDIMLNAREGSIVSLNVTRGEEKLVIDFEITSSAISKIN